MATLKCEFKARRVSHQKKKQFNIQMLEGQEDTVSFRPHLDLQKW